MIGEQIKFQRKFAKMSQSKLAKKTKIAQTEISRIESGERNVSMDLLGRIAKALGCKVNVILKKEGK